MVEKRLIDANALSETLAIVAKKMAKSDAQKALMGRVFYILDHRHEEVVRCKDCKWFDPIKQECCGSVVTDNEGGADFTINFEENDFCSFGERRSNETINI